MQGMVADKTYLRAPPLGQQLFQYLQECEAYCEKL